MTSPPQRGEWGRLDTSVQCCGGEVPQFPQAPLIPGSSPASSLLPHPPLPTIRDKDQKVLIRFAGPSRLALSGRRLERPALAVAVDSSRSTGFTPVLLEYFRTLVRATDKKRSRRLLRPARPASPISSQWLPVFRFAIRPRRNDRTTGDVDEDANECLVESHRLRAPTYTMPTPPRCAALGPDVPSSRGINETSL